MSNFWDILAIFGFWRKYTFSKNHTHSLKNETPGVSVVVLSVSSVFHSHRLLLLCFSGDDVWGVPSTLPWVYCPGPPRLLAFSEQALTWWEPEECSHHGCPPQHVLSVCGVVAFSGPFKPYVAWRKRTSTGHKYILGVCILDYKNGVQIDN